MKIKISISKVHKVPHSIFVFPVFHVSSFQSHQCAIAVGWLWVMVSIFIDWPSPNKQAADKANNQDRGTK